MRQLSLLLLCCAGCASGMKFTRPEELDEIARAPLPTTPKHEIANVAEWELSGPLPETIAHVPLTDASKPFVKELLAGAPGRFHVMTDLTCVAAQTARFELANEGRAPSLLLRRFIASRCGCPSDHVTTNTLYGESPEDLKDEELVSQWSAKVQEMIATLPAGSVAGIALERKGKLARVVVSHAVDEVVFEPVSIFPVNDAIIIKGVMKKTVEDVSGAINQGAASSAECIENPMVKLPRFELACPVQKGSPHDWVGLWAREPGRFLAYPMFTAVVFTAGASAKFVRPTAGQAKDASPAAMLEALNAVRAQLQRPALTLSAQQTEQAKSLVPPYLAAELNGDESKVDRIALGLMAGWRVDGPVTRGWFTSLMVPTEGGAETLAALLELPGQRNALLSKEARVLAVGQSESSGLLESLICTYSLLDEPQPTVERQRGLFDKLNAERKRRGLPDAQWVQLPTKTAETVAAQVRAASMTPSDGIDELMEEAQRMTHKRVNGWQFYASSLDEVEFPDELLERPTLQVMLTIAPYKRKDMPWTQYVFMVVLFEGATTQA